MDTATSPTDHLVLATPDTIAGVPRRDVDGTPGATQRVLWADGTRVAGMMEFAADAVMAEHTHVDRGHHIWVVEGSATVCGERLDAGAIAPHSNPTAPSRATPNIWVALTT